MLRTSLFSLGALGVSRHLIACDDTAGYRWPVPTATNLPNLGSLGAANADGVRTPAGFTARIIARTGEALGPSALPYIVAPDGGATFARADGGFLYAVNSESFAGGVSVIRFDRDANVVDFYPVLTDTLLNCSGGKMPWGTWMSCEEVANGRVFECDPTGREAAVHWPLLGSFAHEAVAYDTANHHLYLTEDRTDGRFYRFRPTGLSRGYADFSSGTLEVLRVLSGEEGACEWLEVTDPTAATVDTRLQQPTSTAFSGGEGLYIHEGIVYFTTKGDNRVWAYDIAENDLTIVYDADTHPVGTLRGVDNLIATPFGELLVAEDGDDMQIVAIRPDGSLVTLVQVDGHVGSEITGIAFDPSFQRLFFASQRGVDNGGVGITYMLEGPFFLYD